MTHHNKWKDDDIVREIVTYTPTKVKDLLDREEAPTFQDILSPPWKSDCRHCGAYLKLIYRDENDPTALNHYAYVGSATSWLHGYGESCFY
ncbi:uncharacterized protein BDW43DRAFT_294290 [Aspergillus alliaceus]|uniref:uncharacterized protein n=1 Tax=Petromyces alliaceus TaxID=209559 RepID=UPI0012A4E73A|nr:uncharacterized protein BDW43DRAFT_294290 [Aspergillus alliaceus]KAB8227386.1 hypothetical protein BDW43DRAFT_294290 [Aspergillus alliaceus]